MKNLILLVFLFLGYSSINAQKIKIDEVDKFTKERIVETSFEKIISDKNVLNKMSGANSGQLHKNIWLAFRKVGDIDLLRIKWSTNKILSLSSDADIIFLDKEGNTYTFKNTEYTIAGKGEGTIGFVGSAIYGLDIYMIGDVSALKDKIITDMRIHTTDGYIDFEISKKASDKINKLCTLFLETTK